MKFLSRDFGMPMKLTPHRDDVFSLTFYQSLYIHNYLSSLFPLRSFLRFSDRWSMFHAVLCPGPQAKHCILSASIQKADVFRLFMYQIL